MSHNVTLTNVKFKDLTLLRNVVNNLAGAAATLHPEATTFRTFLGQPNHCDACITLPGPHDIGLLKNTDGSYSPVFDPYQMSEVFKSPHGDNFIGVLAQEYALQEAEYEAANLGYNTERVEGEKGLVTLSIFGHG